MSRKFEKYYSEVYPKIKKNPKKISSIIQKIIHPKFYFAAKMLDKETEKINKKHEQFTASLAHDLKNNLSAAMGFSEVLVEDIAKLSKEEISEIANAIKKNVKNTNDLLLRTIELYKIRNGEMKAKFENINLKKVVDECSSFLHLEEKEIKFVNRVDPKIVVWADAYMLNTILRNLISNAKKYSFRKGVIIVDAKENKRMVKVFVIDNGIGMSKEKVESLLGSNGKTNSTKGTENEKGHGIGFKIVKEMVEENGGRISISSEQEKGTVVSFTLLKEKVEEKDSSK